ncbi:hypothetical protein BDV95DRAFT_268698 [Massariosphaeria phaeospora]|uniref:Uncharacterized protein n=1 Tax=Massariosphaeria phaeospora TaxID=100035 RepID=A0A7C8I0V1_9PLEO|nr:hypothetical protein BDV95DRAFT_268698 [Massariosphaeria phaeospora]
MIYEAALDAFTETTIHRSSKKPKRRTPRNAQQSTRAALPESIPFLSLTQTCQTIRNDFRICWLRKHVVQLSNMQQYARCFMMKPRQRPKAAFATWYNTIGALRICVDDLMDADIVRLLQLKAFKPDCKITLESSASRLESSVSQRESSGLQRVLLALNTLISNWNPAWVRWITSGGVTQARFQISKYNCTLHVVMTQEYALPWMFVGPFRRWPYGFPATMGLDIDNLWVEFRVCY